MAQRAIYNRRREASPQPEKEYKMTEITAKLGKGDDGPSCKVDFTLPDSIEAAGELWGDEVCLSRINSAVTIDVQAVMRRGLQADPPKSASEIQTMVDEFSPGVKRQGKSKTEKAEQAFGALTSDEQEELFKKFQPAAKSKGRK